MSKLIQKLYLPFIHALRRRSAVRFEHDVAAVLCGSTVALADVGAAEGVSARWLQIAPHLDVTAFDPDPRASESLANRGAFHSFIAHQTALWDHNGTVGINLCKKPTVSSCLKPNRVFLDNFPNADRFDVERVDEAPCRRLDGLLLQPPDFLKIDVQGAVMNVLRGGEEMLPDVLGLEVEVEFAELYKDQPLIGCTLSYLQAHGFQLIDFVNLQRWERDAFSGYGQCVFGDVLFLRSPESLAAQGALDPRRIRAYLAICILYGKYDLALAAADLHRDALDSAGKDALERLWRADQALKRHYARLVRVTRAILPRAFRLHYIQ